MEEKIIDGVDVAECEHHLSTGYCQLQMIFQGMVLKLPFGKHLECNLCNKECYYKQLKRLDQENEELKSLCEKYGKINEQDTKDYAELTEKYNKMVKISEENLIKYEDLRIDNQKLIIEIENLNSQIDFEAQKQEILLKENVELKSYIKEDLVPHTKIYIQALEEIREIATDLKQTKIPFCEIEEKIQNIISEVLEDEIYELCPHCENEVVLKNVFKRQICSECKKEILPCSICEKFNCQKCPLEKTNND